MSQGVLEYIASLVGKDKDTFVDELIHFVRENKYNEIGHGIRGTFLDVLYSTGHQNVKSWSRHLKRGHVKKNDLVFIVAFLDIVIFVFDVDESSVENKLQLKYALNDKKTGKQISLQVIVIKDEIYLNLDKKAKSEAAKIKKRAISAAAASDSKPRNIRGTRNATKVETVIGVASASVPDNAGTLARAQRVASARHETRQGYSRHARAQRAAFDLSQKKLKQAEEEVAAAAAAEAKKAADSAAAVLPTGIVTGTSVSTPVVVSDTAVKEIATDDVSLDKLAADAAATKVDLSSAKSSVNPYKEYSVLGQAAFSEISFVGAAAPSKRRRIASFLHGVTH